jgi:cytoskeletal protein CcmA (bactofilin family)
VRKDRTAVQPAEIKAFLGEGTEFKGVLSFQGTVRIDGHVEGEVVGDDLLIVGEPGFLKAEVEVGTVVNSGRIVGNVRAKKRVELLASSVVSGNITTPSLVISEGAVFNGTCLMAEPEVGAGPEPEGSGRAG